MSVSWKRIRTLNGLLVMIFPRIWVTNDFVLISHIADNVDFYRQLRSFFFLFFSFSFPFFP